MRRGTTPTNLFKSNVDLTEAEVLYITYKQRGVIVIEKTIEDVTIDEKNFEETLRLDPKQKVEIQVRARFPGGRAIGSNIVETTVGRILKDGEI